MTKEAQATHGEGTWEGSVFESDVRLACRAALYISLAGVWGLWSNNMYLSLLDSAALIKHDKQGEKERCPHPQM